LYLTLGANPCYGAEVDFPTMTAEHELLAQALVRLQVAESLRRMV
jgi:hypothetical protein